MTDVVLEGVCVCVCGTCLFLQHLSLPQLSVTTRCGFEKQQMFYFNIIDNVIHDFFSLPSINSALAAGTSAMIAIHPLSCTSLNHLLFFNNFPSFFLSILFFFFNHPLSSLFPSTFVSSVTLCNVNTCRC